jgi:hypothetical protein
METALTSQRAMRGTVKFLVLLLFASQLTAGQKKARTKQQSAEKVEFCELFQHPARYRGDTVQTTAIYALDMEHATFFDSGCFTEAEANAIFTNRTRGTKKIDKALRNIKLRPALLKVTIVAVFVDEYAGNSITFRGHRYTLRVTKVLAAQKMDLSSGGGSKR